MCIRQHAYYASSAGIWDMYDVSCMVKYIFGNVAVIRAKISGTMMTNDRLTAPR